MSLTNKITSFFRGDSKPATLPIPQNVPKTAFDRFVADGWLNVLTSAGVIGKDKRMAATVDFTFLDQVTLEALYQSDPIAARIVDRPVREMMREGYKFCSTDIDPDVLEEFHQELEGFCVDEKIEEALKWARLYGGAAIFIGADSSNDMLDRSEETELDLEKINKINYLLVFDRYDIFPGTELDLDLSSKNFGYPIYYTVGNTSTNMGGTKKIHHSRLIKFCGVDLPYRLKRQADIRFWGDSVLNRVWASLRDYNTGQAVVPSILQDFVNIVLKMEDLPDIVAQGKTGDEDLQKRLALLNMTSSYLKAMIIRKEESIEKNATPITGIGDLLKGLKDNLMAVTDIPHTILFNESAGGLGSTGDSERLGWYDHIKSMQESQLRSKILRLVEIFRAAKNSVLNKQKGEIGLEFNPLFQLSEKEQIDIRKTQADIDVAYITNGCLDPIEVRQSRFGSGQYSTETTIDSELDKKLEVPSGDQPKA